MTQTQPARKNWRNAELPENTAVFTIGDMHAQHELLATMLAEIKRKIDALPEDTKVHVIPIGDYIDRGSSAPETIDMLIAFEKEMQARGNVKVTPLCGNHDEVFHRLLNVNSIVETLATNMPEDVAKNPNHHRHCITDENGNMSLQGLELALKGGGVFTTIADYANAQGLEKFNELNIFDFGKQTVAGDTPEKRRENANKLVKWLKEAVPPQHKDFFARVYKNSHIVVGDYLFTHAGVDPTKSLAAQGLGEHAEGPPLHERGADYLDAVMRRNDFLWHNDKTLEKLGKIIVHGHTPSAIKDEPDNHIVADGQKHFRLCIDTNVYGKDGALTCFMRHGDDAKFMAVSLNAPDKVQEYRIDEVGQAYSAWTHKVQHPQYHAKGPIQI